ncbi:MAG: hypothetical protein EKK55_03390 [Rhodocyclaceae bacterium]|nr:MAG: hypothetical protein EKK55_03390 [Rhodocyclaceae bacterium]
MLSRRRPYSLYTLGPGGIGHASKKIVGPGEPPDGFVSATTSSTEWIWYWASAKVYDDPPDPRIPPYWGGAQWGYQIANTGGRAAIFGSVIDFVYYMPSATVGIRIQTKRYHEETTPQQKAYDLAQRNALSRYVTIVDVYEQDFIADRTGEAACRRVVDALGGKRRMSPGKFGFSRRVRPYSV